MVSELSIKQFEKILKQDLVKNSGQPVEFNKAFKNISEEHKQEYKTFLEKMKDELSLTQESSSQNSKKESPLQKFQRFILRGGEVNHVSNLLVQKETEIEKLHAKIAPDIQKSSFHR